MATGRARAQATVPGASAGVTLLEQRDRKLVDEAQRGDNDAFKSLVQKYHKKVYSIALGMVHNPEDALDISQEAFIKVHKYLDNFKGSSSFYTWLYRIVINLCIDFLRREGRYASVGYEDGQSTATATGDASTGDPVIAADQTWHPGQELGRREVGDQITKAIEALSPNHRAVILMREVEGLSYREMSDVLNCSQGTIMSRLHHARFKLRRLLKDYVGKELRIEEEDDSDE
jgi:RNA polymerase sigma-70 factor (ECF subfamily)